MEQFTSKYKVMHRQEHTMRLEILTRLGNLWSNISPHKSRTYHNFLSNLQAREVDIIHEVYNEIKSYYFYLKSQEKNKTVVYPWDVDTKKGYWNTAMDSIVYLFNQEKFSHTFRNIKSIMSMHSVYNRAIRSPYRKNNPTETLENDVMALEKKLRQIGKGSISLGLEKWHLEKGIVLHRKVLERLHEIALSDQDQAISKHKHQEAILATIEKIRAYGNGDLSIGLELWSKDQEIHPDVLNKIHQELE